MRDPALHEQAITAGIVILLATIAFDAILEVFDTLDI